MTARKEEIRCYYAFLAVCLTCCLVDPAQFFICFVRHKVPAGLNPLFEGEQVLVPQRDWKEHCDYSLE